MAKSHTIIGPFTSPQNPNQKQRKGNHTQYAVQVQHPRNQQQNGSLRRKHIDYLRGKPCTIEGVHWNSLIDYMAWFMGYYLNEMILTRGDLHYTPQDVREILEAFPDYNVRDNVAQYLHFDF